MLYTDATLIEAINAGDDTPETIADPITGRPAFRVGYHSTDGWRGYYETTPFAESYEVTRFYSDDRPNETIHTGLTREEAVAHCDRDDTKGDGWFDGWRESAPIGWEKVDEGTVCGEWDDVPAGTRTSDVEAKLNAMAEADDILVVVLPTSNVFAMAYDAYRKVGV